MSKLQCTKTKSVKCERGPVGHSFYLGWKKGRHRIIAPPRFVTTSNR